MRAVALALVGLAMAALTACFAPIDSHGCGGGRCDLPTAVAKDAGYDGDVASSSCHGDGFSHTIVIITDGGVCQFVGCSQGWDNCDSDLLSNGCETSLDTDENCGACGNACQGGSVCRPGANGSLRCVPQMCPGTGCDTGGMECACAGASGLCASTNGVLFCCTGCVDGAGVCQPGTTTTACGAGSTCQACTGACADGVCR